MRILSVLVAIIALAACDGGVAVSNEQAAMEDEVGKQRELRERNQGERLVLLNKGQQGCPGHVLRDEELRNAVAHKKMLPPIPAVYDASNGARTYRANGQLESSESFQRTAIGRYSIANDQLCHENLYGMRDTPWCSRLIKSAKGGLMEEVLNDRNPESLHLGCVPIKFQDLEASK